MIRIEAAKPENIPRLVELIRDFAVFEKLEHVCDVTEIGLREALFREDVRTFSLLASTEGRCVGYAIFYPVFKTFRGIHSIYLEDLYVTPEARGKGVGLALLKAVARQADALGFERLDWQALTWNTPALLFYESIGAERDDGNIDFRLTGEALAKLIS